MRPRIVEYLNSVFGTDIFQWLVPYPALVYALTMFVGMVIFVRRCKRVELSQYHAVGASISAMIGGLIGARLLFVLIYFDRLSNFVDSLFTVSGATISWGAYLGGISGFSLYFLFQRQKMLPYLNVLGSVLAIGPFIGRWSCFLNGCDFGSLSSLPWSVVYPHGSFPFVAHVRRGLIDPLAPHSLAVHPVQIYLSVNGLLLFIVFTYIWKKYRLAPGVLFCSYWAAYSFTRFFLEFFRGDTQIFYFEIFSIGQVMTIIIFMCSLTGIFFLNREHQSTRPLHE